ncbi:uncharacterized protein [Chironomus tepperi]|uniref:uncharacterized protein n=1 Tax=Chironomus tepperi TaxID=113505 RepID=UPI00391F0DD7
MKLVTGLLVFALALGAYSQEETLLTVQDELGLTHRFFETIMGINRGQLSAYIYRMTRIVMDSYLNTYEFIYVNGAEAREHIASLVPENPGQQECLDTWTRRFELQKQRFGQRLARCIGNVHHFMVVWNNVVNGLHSNGQLQAAQVQNIGFNLFARTTAYDGPEDFAALMKVDLRDAIFRILGVVDQVEEFIRNISIDFDNIEIEFTRCDRELEEAVMREIQIEVDGANACVGAGPTDPNPTRK